MKLKFVIQLIALFQLLLLSRASASEAVFDLSTWDGSIEFFKDVEWDFYWEEFIPINSDYKSPSQKIKSERYWPNREFGYASYRLRIKGIADSNNIFEIRTPSSGITHKVFLFPVDYPNAIMSAESGQVASKSEDEKPSKSASSIVFRKDYPGDYILIIYVSNFTDLNGGLWRSPRFGYFKDVQDYFKSIHRFNLISISIIASLTVYLFMIWYRRKSSIAPLYLSISGLFSSVRIITLDAEIAALLGDNFYSLLRTVEIVTIPAAGLYFLMFLKASFPEAQVPRRLYRTILISTQIVIFMVLIFEHKIQVELLPILQIIALIQFAIDGSIVYQAVRKRLQSSQLALLGYLTVLCSAIFDIGTAYNLTDSTIYFANSFGAIVMILYSQVVAHQFAKAYRKAEKLTLALEEKDRSRTIFFQNTSHELRTPLNGIIGYLDLIQEGKYGEIPDKVRTQVSKSLALADSLKHQVNNILDLARAKKGDLTLKNQQIVLSEIKKDADNLAEGLSLTHPDDTYHSTIESEHPSIIIDKEKVTTILRNLLGNAFKFRDEAKANSVTLEIIELNYELTIKIIDTGIGIHPNDLDKIFDEFSQLSSDERRAYEGSGLGLTMVKAIVDLMQGEIHVSSAPGMGTTVQVRIPCQEASDILEIAANENQEFYENNNSIDKNHILTKEFKNLEKSSNLISIESTKAWPILIVDDNEVNCDILVEILNCDDYSISTSRSGKEALELMRTHPPALLLLDMMMPGFSGEDVIKEMKNDAKLRLIPIIVITARASSEDRNYGLSLGADDYVAKPILASEIRIRVSNIITRISLQIRHQRFIENALEHEKKINELQSNLISESSHALRTPLNGMIGITESLIEDSNLPSKLKVKVNDILAASKRLSRVIDNVLKPYESDKTDSLALMNQDLTVKNSASVIENRLTATGESASFTENVDYYIPKILIVDDEDLNRRVIRTHLDELDYDLYEARNAKEALEVFQEEKYFDLILLDVMMPDMSGYEVAKEIRKTVSPNTTPIVMLTAKQQVADLVEGFDSGANDYIHKPFSRGELLARIKSHLHLSSINKAMQRFIPFETIRLLGYESISQVRLGDAVEMDFTILFADVFDFTKFSESSNPDHAFQWLNECYRKIGPIIRQAGGFIDKYIGDGVMALFPNNPTKAVESTVAIHRAIAELNQIKLGIGIHFGSTMLCTIGEPERFETTALSDAVNISARLEGACRILGSSLLISHSTFEMIEDKNRWQWRYLGKILFKGKSAPIGVYELLEIDIKCKEKSVYLIDFENALNLFSKGRIAEAKASFENLLEKYPFDLALRVYLDFIKNLDSNETPQALVLTAK